MKSFKILRISHLLIAALFLFSVISCERDDICAEATATTPHLIIRFYNIDSRSELKAVRHMSVSQVDNPKAIINDKTTDTILLPLKMDNLNGLNTTRFELRKDVDYDTDDKSTTQSNPDIIEVSYTPELIYVSRACGYKGIYNDVTAGLNNDNDNDTWIIDIDVINSTIKNEDAAHINIYH